MTDTAGEACINRVRCETVGWCCYGCKRLTAAENGGRTGHPPGMLQDDDRKLSRWLSERIDSRMHAREAAESIGRQTEGEA